MGHHKHHYSLNNFIKDAGKVTKPVTHFFTPIAKTVNKDFIHVVDTNAGMVNNAVNKTTSNLSLPLVIGGVAIVAFIVMQKR
jgi:hypothetical protein